MEDGLMVIAGTGALVAAAAGLVKNFSCGMKSRVGAVLGYLIIFIIFFSTCINTDAGLTE